MLVIVHPDSACGSADFNLGRECAEYQRLEMQLLVEQWEGGVLVLDGGMTDELDGFRRSWNEWGTTIKNAIKRASENGFIAERVLAADGSEYPQQQAIVDLVNKYALTPTNTDIVLTGAWVDDDGGGCVHSVREELEKIGFTPTVEDAMNLDFEMDESEEDLEEDTSPEMPIIAPTRRQAKF